MSRTDNAKERLRRLLNEELECLRQILYETQSFLETANDASMEMLGRLLQARDHWIHRLKTLESQREVFEKQGHTPGVKRIQDQINETAQALVVVDAKLMDLLNTRKAQVIKEISRIVENRKGMVVGNPKRHRGARILDIRVR